MRNRIATGQRIECTKRFFVEDRRLLWAVSCEVDVLASCKGFTGAYNSTIICVETILHSVILYIHMPAVDEVSVEAIACSITVGENKLSAAGLINLIGEI